MHLFWHPMSALLPFVVPVSFTLHHIMFDFVSVVFVLLGTVTPPLFPLCVFDVFYLVQHAPLSAWQVRNSQFT